MRFVLRWFCRILAVALAGLLLAAPRFAPAQPDALDEKALWLFANDATLRKTAIASAVGLLLTAQIFFRPRKTTIPNPPDLPRSGALQDDVPIPPPPPRRE